MTMSTRTRCALTLDQLRRECVPEAILAGPETGVIGQEDAMESLGLGLQMATTDYTATHYNVCVVGQPNTGRKAKTLIYLRNQAAKIDFKPDDAVCLHNFENPRKPIIVYVPNGMAKRLKLSIAGLGLMAMKKMAEDSEKAVTDEVKKMVAAHRKLVDEAQPSFSELGLSLVEPHPGSLALGVVKPDGSVTVLISEIEAFMATLPEEEQSALKQNIEEGKKRMDVLLGKLRSNSINPDDVREKVKEANTKKLMGSAGAILSVFGKSENLLNYLVRLVDELAGIATYGLPEGKQGYAVRKGIEKMATVEILVDNTGVDHPPVIYAEEPQYSQVFGSIGEPGDKEGSIRADHTTVEAGDWLRANGGYLVIEIRRLLEMGGGIALYKMLQVMRTRKLRIEGKASFVDIGIKIEFKVEDTPVNVRVVVICDWRMAQILRYVVPDFDDLFRVTAEFNPEMSVGEATSAYATFAKLYADKGETLPASNAAVAKLVEYGSRRVDDRFKATTEFGVLKDLIVQASHWAKLEGFEQIEAQHVQKAVDERYRRSTMLVRRYQEHWDNGHILLSLTGERVGVVNGLVVMGGHSDFAFGMPKRVTARAFAGKDKVVLVQRETDSSGPTSNAAVETIAGWLAGQYGRRKPLSLSVKLSFEQVYGGIDGDSATVAEVIATLSAISGLPVDQYLVVTGSMNQIGEVQPIGGVNHKIEGHVGLLNRKAIMDVGHGAVIPVQNLDNLMVNDEVIEAVSSGMYRLYAISHIDEAIEIFFGLPAATVHKVVKEKLAEIGAKKPWLLARWLKGFVGLFKRPEPLPLPDFQPPPPEPPKLLPAPLKPPAKKPEPDETESSDAAELIKIDISWDDDDEDAAPQGSEDEPKDKG